MIIWLVKKKKKKNCQVSSSLKKELIIPNISWEASSLNYRLFVLTDLRYPDNRENPIFQEKRVLTLNCLLCTWPDFRLKLSLACWKNIVYNSKFSCKWTKVECWRVEYLKIERTKIKRTKNRKRWMPKGSTLDIRSKGKIVVSEKKILVQTHFKIIYSFKVFFRIKSKIKHVCLCLFLSKYRILI